MIFLMILIFIIFSLFSFFVFKKRKHLKKEGLCIILSFIIFAIGLEASFFNVNFYNSFNNEEISLNNFLSNCEVNNSYVITRDNRTLFFSEINEEINNIHIKLTESSAQSTDFTISFSDEANYLAFGNPARTIYKNVTKSHYINIHPSGKVSGLGIEFDLDENEVLVLEGISLNVNRPFNFSIFRIFLIFTILCLLYIFSPKSEYHKKKFSENLSEYSYLATILICFECLVIVALALANPTFIGLTIEDSDLRTAPLKMANHNMYDELAKAFLNGKVYIDKDDVPDSLKNLSNPYDTVLRAYTASESGDNYPWDVAYFNGHYYVYFGIVPLLLMYLPFRAITDAPFPTVFGIIIFAVLFTVGVYKLITLIAEKKFKNISISNLLLIIFTVINSCGLIFLVKRPDFYSIPIITGLTFTVFGIYNWLKGLCNEKHRISNFLTGSLFMALVAGCRPQLLLMSFLAVPFFFKRYFITNDITKKQKMKELIVLSLPYIFIASGLMYYNLIRFGSPFDFGSNYQLTTNDVTKRGMNAGRVGLGLFTYLFQPPSFSATFPFIRAVSVETNYAGKTIFENCFGGLIASTPFLWFIFLINKSKEKLKSVGLFGITSFILLCGMVIVFFDTQAGGLLQRYISDFGFLFCFASAFIIMSLLSNTKTENEKSLLNSLIFSSAVLSIFYTITLAFSVSDVTIDTQNPLLFGCLSQIVQFWL